MAVVLVVLVLCVVVVLGAVVAEDVAVVAIVVVLVVVVTVVGRGCRRSDCGMTAMPAVRCRDRSIMIMSPCLRLGTDMTSWSAGR